MNSFLNNLDLDFRDSLYNHYNHHNVMGRTNQNFYLDRSSFSFKNIHMRGLGNVRWYSTHSHTSNDKSSIKNKQDLLQFNYREIDDILSKRNTVSLNILQRNIEDMLFKGQNWFNTNKSKPSIKYNSVSIYFIVEKKKKILKNLLSNSANYSGNTKSHATEYIPWVKKRLNKLGSDIVMVIFMLIPLNL